MKMTPASEAELAELITVANRPFRIRGGGTRGLGPDKGDELTTLGLCGISLYEPGAMTLVAQAGTPISQIETALKAENQRLAFEPPDLREVLGLQGESTLGGVAASNASGPRRIMVGACRDFMLGVRLVDGAGNIIKNGGRVMKNVTGYDLVKLMSGAHGTLGILSEVSIKVLPDVEMQLCLVLDGLDVTRSVAAMSLALGSPFEVSGAARDDTGRVCLRLEGFEASVRYRAAQLQSRLAEFGTVDILDDQNACTTIWKNLRNARAFAKAAGDLWRISVKPSDAPNVIEAIKPIKAQLDWGGGLIWALVPEGTDLRPKITVAGHATLMRATPFHFASLGRFQPEPEPLAKTASALRGRFDPKGFLNPGLMGSIR